MSSTTPHVTSARKRAGWSAAMASAPYLMMATRMGAAPAWMAVSNAATLVRLGSSLFGD